MSVRAALLVAMALSVGCDDDSGPVRVAPDLSASAPRDLSTTPPPRDLATPGGDGSCAVQHFSGFAGVSDVERRVDCACGCVLDPLDDVVVSGIWATPHTNGGSFAPGAGGLQVTVTRSSGTEFASLASLLSAGPFFVDGDFDLLVDYRLAAPLPPDAHAVLVAQNAAGVANSVTRERAADGTNQVASVLGGQPLVARAAATQSGTLELFRRGNTVEAVADGALISQFTGASAGRLSLALNAQLSGCDADMGASCQMVVVWRNLRMSGGALVDRR